jgi:flagellin-like hook-associated protein FlgL
MSTVDQIASATGLTDILNRQQAKQAGVLKELASGNSQSSIANALATPFETESQTIPVVQQNITLAGNVLSTSGQALSSVAANLTQALATASQALSAPASERGVLAQNFNELIDQTQSFVNNATVNGLNLVGSNAQAMKVNTTTEGGQLTVAAAPSSASALGVTDVSAQGWSSTAAIQASINQIQTALNQVSSTQSKLAAAQTALSAASMVNQSSALAASSSAATLVGADVGKAVLDEKKTLAQIELSTYAGEEQSTEHARNILGLLND